MTSENRPGVIDGIDVLGRPTGRYEQYEQKMRMMYQKIAFIKRHKLLISTCSVLLIFSVFAFIFFIGAFTGELRYNDMVYGDIPNYEVGCFFSKPSFEFSSDGESYSTSMPTIPGEYRVRAVSENPFGMKRYSNSAVFVLSPRSLTISVKNTQMQYGDLSEESLHAVTSVKGLAGGDSVTGLKYDQYEDTWNNITVSVSSYSIVNESGEDVSAAYNISTKSGEISLSKRAIKLATEAKSVTYNGHPFNDAQLLISSGSLAYNDVITYEFPSFSADVGTYTISPSSLLIKNENGEDVTYKYSIRTEYNHLTVTPATLLFSTEGATKVFDNTDLTADGWELLDGSELVPGHKLEAKTTGSRFYVGSTANGLKFSVTDKNGNDVTKNYQSKADLGILKIDPIVLKFKTPSATKVYDGFPLKSTNWEHIEGEVLDVHYMYAFLEAQQTLAGTRRNNLQIIIQDKDFNDMIGRAYEIVVDEGTLEVTKRPITLTSESASMLYNGRPLTCHKYKVTEGSFAANNKIRNASFTGTQTEVGSSPNFFSIIIGDGGYSNSTLSYDITYVYGTLEVLPNENFNPNDIDGDGIPNEYDDDIDGDGIPNYEDSDIDGDGIKNEDDLDADGDGVNDFEESTEIQTPPPSALEYIKLAEVKLQTSGQPHQLFFKSRSYGDYNGHGFEAAKVWDSYESISASVRYSPMNYAGMCAHTSGYAKSNVYIKLFNNCPTIAPYYTYIQDKISLDNDVLFSGSGNSYSVYYMYTGAINDLSAFYKIKQNPSITKQEAEYREYVYDTYLQIPDSTKQSMLKLAKEHGLLYGQSDTLDMVSRVSNYIRSAGKYNLATQPYPDNVDVAVYFLEVSKEGICQHFAASATMMYRALGIPARYTVGFSSSVVPGKTTTISTHDAHAWVEIYLDGIGWIPVEVTGSSSDEQAKINLQVAAYNAIKEYDGNTFGSIPDMKVTLLSGYLLEGHTMYVTLSEEGINKTLPGSYKNSIVKIKILDSSGADVTNKYYNIQSVIPGTMTIEKRTITIQTGSAKKYYDGDPLSCQDWYLIRGSILPEHYATVELNKEITVAGTTLNTPKNIVIREIGTDKDVTDRYTIDTVYGTLTVERQPN